MTYASGSGTACPSLADRTKSEPCNTDACSALSAAPLDISFVVDGSGSIPYGDFELQKQFILTLAKTFPEDTTIRYGVVQFSSQVREERAVRINWPHEASRMHQMRRSTSIGGGLAEGGKQLMQAPTFSIWLTEKAASVE